MYLMVHIRSVFGLDDRSKDAVRDGRCLWDMASCQRPVGLGYTCPQCRLELGIASVATGSQGLTDYS